MDKTAAKLKVDLETVRVWIHEGKLRAVLPGGRKLGYGIPESTHHRLLSGEAEGKGDPLAAQGA